jgi:hypothetical protein
MYHPTDLSSLFSKRIITMYHDDPYDPNLPNDYDESYEYESNIEYQQEDPSISSISTVRNKKRYQKENKVQEKGSSSIDIIVNGKKTKVGYYYTGFTPGLTIRHAVSGMYEKGDLVGSRSEDLYFKVCQTPAAGCNEPHFLYYYGPAEYEKHFHCEVSKETKDAWNVKVTAARRRHIMEEDRQTQRNMVVIQG